VVGGLLGHRVVERLRFGLVNLERFLLLLLVGFVFQRLVLLSVHVTMATAAI
jgi:hypothetical protein